MAEVVGRARQDVASMEPRFFERGNGALRGGDGPGGVIASMEPRFFERGNYCQKWEGGIRKMLQWSRAFLSAEMSASAPPAVASSCFNGAALF